LNKAVRGDGTFPNGQGCIRAIKIAFQNTDSEFYSVNDVKVGRGSTDMFGIFYGSGSIRGTPYLLALMAFIIDLANVKLSQV
jgi:hypothetical protein